MNFRDKKYKRHLLCKALPLLLAGILSFVQLSCTNDGTPTNDTANIHVTFDTSKATRALSANESTVNDVTVLVFDSNSNLVGSNYTTFTGAGPYSMNVTARTGNCTIYAIANTGSSSYFKGIATISQFKAMFDQLSSGDDLTNRNAALMFGKMTYNITPGATISGLTLTRLCTKLTFNINPSNGIMVTGYQLCNVPLSSYLTNENSPSYNPGGTYGNCSAYTVGTPTANATVSATYYMYENLAGTGLGSTSEILRTSANAPTNATYLLVYAKTSSWHSTYRIYLGGTSTTDYTNFNIPRNNAYSATISITGSGQSDARATYASDIILPTGTYLYSDGTSGTSATAPSGKTTIGIVFSNRVSSEEASKGYHNYALALKDASSGIWSSLSSSTDVGWLTNLGTWSAWYGDNQSGYVGTIDHNMGANSSNPAWYYAKNYNNTVPCNFPCSGWYLPSVGQWWDVVTGLGKVNLNTQQGSSSGGQMNISASTALSNINSLIPAAVGTKIPSGTYYWSASEYSPASMALLVQFGSDSVMIYYYNKSDTYYTVMIRAVVAF